MKTFKQKSKALEKIKDKLNRSKIAVFTSFVRQGEKGMSVAQMRDLRNALRPLDAEYGVEKKTLLDKVLRDARKDGPQIFSYQGSLGVMYAYSDPYAATKGMYQYARKNPILKFYGALFGLEFLDENQIVEFAKIPSRDVLLTRLVGMLMHPIRGLAVALDQIAKQRTS